MSLPSLRTFAGIALISLGLVAIGFYGGEQVKASTGPSVRFVRLTDTIAFDTKTGQNCSIPVKYPETQGPVGGLTLDDPNHPTPLPPKPCTDLQ